MVGYNYVLNEAERFATNNVLKEFEKPERDANEYN